jgi:NNP family nitrate/nitrite transporter-like MFS transporter
MKLVPLAFGTLSFALCFAAWGLISAFAPQFRTATETSLLVAVPVLLGALARLPMGVLADRFGGRVVFSTLMIAVAVPVFLVPSTGSYAELLVVALFLGMAGSSFAVGVGFVSRWTAPAKQGTALGIYGLGNVGQSAAVFLGPVVARAAGWQWVFRGAAVALLAWGLAFAAAARNAPATATAPPRARLGPLLRERHAWVLSLFYFLTFGGFVAFSIYLPVLLRDEFHLDAADAGFRAAGFAVLATLCRPAGGWLADRIGGARVLSGVFAGVVPPCSWPGRGCCRSPSARWDAPRSSAWATAPCSSSCPSCSRTRPGRSPASSARWAGSAGSSRRSSSASCAIASAWSGPASCSSPGCPSSCGA